MDSNQKKLIDFLGKRMTKEESIGFSFEIVLNKQIASAALCKLMNGNSKEVFNVLWAFRNLQDSELKSFPDLPDIILSLFEKFPNDEGILRDGLGLLQNISIPENLQSEVFNVCFGFLQNSSKPIAVKVFSMTVCYNLAELHPDLLKELEIQIKDILIIQGELSPAIFSRGNAILAKINRHLRKSYP